MLTDSTTLARALGGHDDVPPSDAAHLRQLADETEAALIAHEVQFADDQWRDVLRLRALADKMDRIAPELDALRDEIAQDSPDGSRVPLRNALIGQVSDPVFYTRWERRKTALVHLLNAIDVATPAPAVEAR